MPEDLYGFKKYSFKRVMRPTRFQMNSIVNSFRKKPYIKAKISAALREQVWLQHNGRNFESKCATTWCQNKISVFDFQCGHDVPESKGGPTDINNLFPICPKCNLSMGNQYTLKEWSALYTPVKPIPKQKPNPFGYLCCCSVSIDEKATKPSQTNPVSA